MVKFARLVFETRRMTDRQTNRHADWNIFDYVMQLYWTSVFWSYTHYSVVVVLQVWWTSSLFVRSPQTKMSNFHLFYYFATTPMGEVIKHTDVLITILRNHSHGWSIVMSTSVCVCVCLQGDISGIIRAIFAKFFVHVAYSCGSVLFWQVDEIPREGAVLGFSSPLA